MTYKKRTDVGLTADELSTCNLPGFLRDEQHKAVNTTLRTNKGFEFND